MIVIQHKLQTDFTMDVKNLKATLRAQAGATQERKSSENGFVELREPLGSNFGLKSSDGAVSTTVSAWTKPNRSQAQFC